MHRLNFILSVMVLGIGLVVFHLKYEVSALEKTYTRLQRNLQETKEALSVNRAEWEHLNDPQRLYTLNQRYLGLSPVSMQQIISYKAVTGGEICYDTKALDVLIQEVQENTRKLEAE